MSRTDGKRLDWSLLKISSSFKYTSNAPVANNELAMLFIMNKMKKAPTLFEFIQVIIGGSVNPKARKRLDPPTRSPIPAIQTYPAMLEIRVA